MPDENEPNTVAITVPSKDPEKKEDPTPKHTKGKLIEDEKEEQDISEEDLQLKSELEMLVERLKETDTSLYQPALESLRTLIRTSTSSMTSVPKPLKFLRPHYHEMGKIRDSWPESLKEERALLASILSVLAMTYSDTGRRDTLYYRIVSGTNESAGSWGHEYVRHLAAELGEEYVNLLEKSVEEPEETAAPANGAKTEEKSADKAAEGDKEDEEEPPHREYTVEQLRGLGLELVDFFLKHNAEADAVDLLLELESIESLEGKVDDKSYPRVCQYMVSCVPLLVPPDDERFIRTAAAIYAKHDRLPEALALAIRLHDRKLVRKYFEAPTDPVMKKQLAFLIARANIPIHWVHTPDFMEPESDEGDEWGPPPPELSTELADCLGNNNLSAHFRNFGKAVGVEEPRTPEDIYKTHLESRATATRYNIARENLATTFVNAFVNAGFGNEKMIVDAPEGESFIYKNKDKGMLSATASVGMSLLWDHEGGIDHIDKYTYSSDEDIKAGAFMALGILYSNIRAQPDVAWPLLEDHVDNPSATTKIAAMNGLGMAYAGTERHYLVERLAPYVADESSSINVAANAALAMAFVYVGSGNGDVASIILQTLMERETSQLDSEWCIFFGLALGLIFLGRQDAADATLETLKAIEHPIARSAEILVEVCSYAGTGNVLKVQKMLHVCAEHAKPEKPKEEAATTEEADGATSGANAAGDVEMEGNGVAAEGSAAEKKEEEPAKVDMRHQAMAVIGIALIAMGEDVGAEMALRQFQHLMTYGDPVIRKAVPLALGLISASNPQLSILDTLSKYSHDSDLDVAINAIFSMGLVGAGTNNARLAQMLRGLAVYYAKEADCLFMVRIAQGFVHMGKGTIGINPFFHDRQILNPNAIAGLLSLIVSFTEAREFVLGEQHWQLFWIALAMFPQFLITLDEDSNEKPVTVRVGQAVNTVGLAGTRSGISGFQTMLAPVRVGTGERAELGTNEFFPYSSVLEGFVFVKKNPGFDAEDQ